MISARDRIEIESAALLEVSELRDLQAIQHHLPTNAPRTQRRRLPVVLFKFQVVLTQVDADRSQRFQVDLLHIRPAAV